MTAFLVLNALGLSAMTVLGDMVSTIIEYLTILIMVLICRAAFRYLPWLALHFLQSWYEYCLGYGTKATEVQRLKPVVALFYELWAGKTGTARPKKGLQARHILRWKSASINLLRSQAVAAALSLRILILFNGFAQDIHFKNCDLSSASSRSSKKMLRTLSSPDYCTCISLVQEIYVW
jgi:hypothetical protein